MSRLNSIKDALQVDPNSNPMDTGKAKAMLVKERQSRIDKCKDEINSVLTKYNCTMQVQMIIEVNRNIPVVNIVSKD